jgi:hypothetical protein
MKPLLLAAAIAVVGANLSAASAADANLGARAGEAVQTAAAPPAGTPHYEWQYGYVGHHPTYRGHWVLVR